MQNRIVNEGVLRFEDLKWNGENIIGTKQSLVQFPNGWGASIVIGEHSYGGRIGLYEVAVLDSTGTIRYDSGITEDVIGHLKQDEVSEILSKISKLKSEIKPM
jgi:hypothetical protein